MKNRSGSIYKPATGMVPLKGFRSLVKEAVPAGRAGVPNDRPGLLLGSKLLLANDEPKLMLPLPVPLLPPMPLPELCTELVR